MSRIYHFPDGKRMTVKRFLDNWRKDRSARRTWCACPIFCPPQIPHRLNPQVPLTFGACNPTVEGLSSVVDVSQEISLSDLPKLDYGSWSEPMPVAARSEAWVCGRSLAGIAGSNPAGGTDVCREYYVLSGRGLCVELITHPGGVLPSVVRRWVWSMTTTPPRTVTRKAEAKKKERFINPYPANVEKMVSS